MRIKSFIICLTITLCACAKVSKSQNIDTIIQTRSMHIIKSPIYWSLVSPLNFIDTLRKYSDDQFLILYVPPNNWYDKNLIPYLEYKINDTTKSGYAISGLDSFDYFEFHSTIGEQVQCLIQGIKDKMYPPVYWLMNKRKYHNAK